jgi:hypothetical protein
LTTNGQRLQIFLSCASEEKEIGAALKKYLEEYLGNHLSIFFYDHADLHGPWMEKTRLALSESEGIIMILTPLFITKPWLYIELTPFWTSKKDQNVFILCPTMDNNLKNNLPLVREYDHLLIHDPIHVKRFLERLCEICCGPSLEESMVDGFIQTYHDSITKTKTYKAMHSDYVEFMAIRQYETGQEKKFLETVDNLNDDQLRRRIVLRIVQDEKYDLAASIIRSMYDGREIRYTALSIFDAGIEHHALVDAILTQLEDNNEELRNVANYFVVKNRCDDPLFHEMLLRFSNNAETRNVGRKIISIHGMRSHVLEVADEIQNEAEIKNLLLWAIKKRQYHNKIFVQIFASMKNSNHAGIVSEKMQEEDEVFWNQEIKPLFDQIVEKDQKK